MERLTEKIDDHYIAKQRRLSNGKYAGNQMCLDKLGEPEDLEEHGLLATVVRGEWIETKYYTWECNVCGFHPFKGYIPKNPNFNFCPNCGAYMLKHELVAPADKMMEFIQKWEQELGLDHEKKERIFFGKDVE